MNLLQLFLLSTLCTFTFSTCIEERLKELETRQIGKYVPQCNEQVPEKYKPLQCHGSIGYCWCANVDTGEKLSDQFRPWETDERCE